MMSRAVFMTMTCAALVAGCMSAAVAYGATLDGSAAGTSVSSQPALENALPPKRCSLIGTWNNMGGYQYIMTRRKRGTYSPPGCAGIINLVISKKNRSGFHVTATGAGQGCGSFTEDMTWQGSCTYASGTFNEQGYVGPDTWTYAGQPLRSQAGSETLSIGSGLK